MISDNIVNPRVYVGPVHMWCVVTEAPRAGASKYIPQILWNAIICPCPWYLLRSRYQGQGQVITSKILWDVIIFASPWYLLLAQHSSIGLIYFVIDFLSTGNGSNVKPQRELRGSQWMLGLQIILCGRWLSTFSSFITTYSDTVAHSSSDTLAYHVSLVVVLKLMKCP